jgi:hypothetical protein
MRLNSLTLLTPHFREQDHNRLLSMFMLRCSCDLPKQQARAPLKDGELVRRLGVRKTYTLSMVLGMLEKRVLQNIRYVSCVMLNTNGVSLAISTSLFNRPSKQ